MTLNYQKIAFLFLFPLDKILRYTLCVGPHLRMLGRDQPSNINLLIKERNLGELLNEVFQFLLC